MLSFPEVSRLQGHIISIGSTLNQKEGAVAVACLQNGFIEVFLVAYFFLIELTNHVSRAHRAWRGLRTSGNSWRGCSSSCHSLRCGLEIREYFDLPDCF